jgi:hypothetical protein
MAQSEKCVMKARSLMHSSTLWKNRFELQPQNNPKAYRDDSKRHALSNENRKVHLARTSERREEQSSSRYQEHYERMTEQGVNIPRPDAQQMRKVTQGMTNLFRNQINPLIEEFHPERDDWDGWLEFEGAYEESIHLIRMHIMQALKRDRRRLYGARKVIGRLQESREQAAERKLNHQ